MKIQQRHPPEKRKLSPEDEWCDILARHFLLHKKRSNPYSKIQDTISTIKPNSEIEKNRKYYIKLSKIVEKYKIDYDNFLHFCVFNLGLKDIRNIVSIEHFRSYSNYLKMLEQYRVICKNFTETAERIARICLENNITPSQYISHLVKENTLGCEYFAGNISKHFMASIQNFGEIYSALDTVNKEELSMIYECSDQLTQILQDAFLKIKGTTVKPISYTESIIMKFNKEQYNNKTNNNTTKEN